MISSYSQVRGLVKTNPSLLIDRYQHQKYRDYADSFLPRDSGIEVEVAYKKHHFRKLPDIVSFNDKNDLGGYPEKRFRIASGITGLIQLFEVSKFLKKECVFNPDACIHVHVSCADTIINKFEWSKRLKPRCKNIVDNFSCHFDKEIVNANPIMKSGDIGKHAWVNYNHGFGTLEIRAVPMTFEYSDLVHYIPIVHRLVYKLELM